MLRFAPIYKPLIWGGTRFASEFGRNAPASAIGESWELVEHETHESRVAQGPLEGEALGELWRRGALGGSARGRFPFLLKWLDASDTLSVQVHPDTDAVAKLGRGTPKTEAWFVAAATPTAKLMLGHYPGLDAATLRQAAKSGTIGKWLYEVRPHPGDFFVVPAGTLHAIGAGCLLLEVQEPSDTTFRVYDWGRTDAQGNGRELHLEEACAAVRFERSAAPKPEHERCKGPCFEMRALRTGAELAAADLRVIVATKSDVRLTTERGHGTLNYGDIVVAEPADGIVRVAQNEAVLVTEAKS